MIKDVRTYKTDYIIITCVLVLIFFGLIMLYSASNIISQKTYGDGYYLALKQSAITLIGLIVMFIVSHIDYKLITKYSTYIYIICIALSFIALIFGKLVRGSSRWINFNGISFQPSEFLKLALILFMPYIIMKNYDTLNEKNTFYRLVLITYLPAFIVVANNLSTGIILFFIATSVLYIASHKNMFFITIIIIVGLIYIYAYPLAKIFLSMGLLKQYQVGRIFAWKAPSENYDIAYQTMQGINALGAGKIFGKGYLNSVQKNILPEAHNDMIFCIVGEEVGFIGVMLFIVLYVVLIYRIFYVSKISNNIYAKMISFGIAMHIALQVLLNISVVTNLIPNTGVTLPFISFGGSSAIVLLIEIGIILSIEKCEKIYEKEL